MSKAFTRESDGADDEQLPTAPALPTGVNYITRAGYDRLRAELLALIDQERPRIVEIVHWAASNGDRSENGDYLYGKKRLREIDRRIHEVVRLLSLATPNSAIMRHCALEYGVNERQAQNYIARARDVIRQDYSIERSEFLGTRMAILDKVIQRSIKENQHSNAVGALRLQAELARLLDK